MAVNPKTRITRQRCIILEELKKMGSHPSADELYVKVRARLPQISLGTVYRNLQLLTSQGLILTLTTTGAPMRFDWNTSEHYHVRCTECGRVEDYPGRPVVQFELGTEEKTGFEILGYKIEVLGICPECCRAATAEED